MLLSGKDLNYTLELPQAAPMSPRQKIGNQTRWSLSADSEEIAHFMESLEELWSKYVDPKAAALEVNLSSIARQNLKDMFDAAKRAEFKLDVKYIADITALMESAVVEVSRLMRDSYFRYPLCNHGHIDCVSTASSRGLPSFVQTDIEGPLSITK